jgi:MSHA pilin protein MshC
MIELITVIVVVGILAAIGASRFFDNTVFESRAYADQVKSMMRYAQKLAIAQSRQVFVSTESTRFAVCFTAACATQNSHAGAPGGANSGSKTTKANCLVANVNTVGWLCEAPPASVNVAGSGLGFGASFYFDSMGRPWNSDNTASATRTYTFTSGTSVNTINVEAESGYVH